MLERLMVWIRQLKYLFALLLLPGTVLAQSLPTTKISHQLIPTVLPGYRIALRATLSDDDSILAAHCFFRTDSGAPYLFVSMTRGQGDQYSCLLPALSADAAMLEYLFIVVNGNRQVIRSKALSADIAAGDEIPAWQLSGGATERIVVYRELGNFDSRGLSSDDTLYEIAPVRGERYGLLVGLYTEEQIPAELNAAHGYFGGFAIDGDDTPPRPVKGYAIGLKPPSAGTEPGVEQPRDSPGVEIIALGAPSIGGNDWSGFFQTTGGNNRQSITADIAQSGGSVTIVTSKSGLGHRLVGSINSSGHMLLYDQYDGEDWTTHYGPATTTQVAIYDYICPTCSQLNEINLQRPPPPPQSVAASDGVYLDRIVVTWSSSSGASSYDVYRCTTSSTGSCGTIGSTSGNSSNDTGVAINNIYYYRIKACNSGGCSDFSSYNTGYLKSPTIAPILMLLLLD